MEPIKFIEQEFAIAQSRIRELEADDARKIEVVKSAERSVNQMHAECRLKDAEMSELKLTIKRLKDQLAECEAVVNLIMRLTHAGEFYEAARAYRAKYPGAL